VSQSNGRIEVRSRLGHGSSFKIYLPTVEQAKVNQDIRNDSSKPAFSGETVLVVEDARPLRDLICEALTRFGCTVLSACDGPEALRLVEQRQTAIDLLVTDIVMPGMNGQALAKRVRLLHPETRVLYMTGYSGEFLRADLLMPGVSLIQKPFAPADLGHKISKMLAGNRKSSQGAASSLHRAAAPKAATARTSG
jgi:CheY-like chemotaxis protein